MGVLTKKGRKIILVALSVIFAGCLMFTATITASAATRVVDFDVVQSFSGINISDTVGTYTFSASNETNPMPSGASSSIYNFTLDENNSENIKIDFSEAHTGIYLYELKQTTPNQDGYRYDNQVYTVKCMVTYDSETKSKTVEVFIYRSDGNKTASVVFNNSYQADSAVEKPPVVKTVSGSTSSDSVFKFKLKSEGESNPMPSGSSNGVKYITIQGSGTAEFGTWIYTESGTYVYKVSEVNTGVAGYTYDKTVYTLTDVVTVDQYGGMLVERSIEGNMVTSASKFKFVNRYANSSLMGVKTGDIAQTGLYILISAAAAAMAFIVAKPRRHRNGGNSARS